MSFFFTKLLELVVTFAKICNKLCKHKKVALKNYYVALTVNKNDSNCFSGYIHSFFRHQQANKSTFLRCEKWTQWHGYRWAAVFICSDIWHSRVVMCKDCWEMLANSLKLEVNRKKEHLQMIFIRISFLITARSKLLCKLYFTVIFLNTQLGSFSSP